MKSNRNRHLSLKALWAVFALLGTVVAACGGASEVAKEVEQLMAKVEEQQALLDEAELFTDAVNTMMDSVIMADGSTILQIREGQPTSREKLIDNLESYKLMLDGKRRQLAELQEQLEKSEGEHAKKMQEVIAKFTAQLDAKDAEIADLKKQIESKDFDIARLKQHVETLTHNVNDLTNKNIIQSRQIEMQDEMLNEAYIIMGSKKELKAAGVVEGGNLFKKSKLDMSKIDGNVFEKIDVRHQKSFEIPSGSPKIMTQMPEDSYTLTKNGKTSVLTITNVARFWSVSNYLVIQY